MGLMEKQLWELDAQRLHSATTDVLERVTAYLDAVEANDETTASGFIEGLKDDTVELARKTKQIMKYTHDMRYID